MKKLVALLLCLMMVVPATLASAETAEGKVLNIWCWNDEFQSRFNAYYPEVKEIAEDKSTTTLNDGTMSSGRSTPTKATTTRTSWTKPCARRNPPRLTTRSTSS